MDALATLITSMPIAWFAWGGPDGLREWMVTIVIAVPVSLGHPCSELCVALSTYQRENETRCSRSLAGELALRRAQRATDEVDEC
jgi:hypothetical protein